MILIFLLLLFILKFNGPAVYLDYLTGLLILLLLASAVFTAWVRKSMQIGVEMPAARVHEGDELRVTVKVLSPPLHGKLTANVEIRDLQCGKRIKEKHLLSDVRSELIFRDLAPGTAELSIPYVSVSGIFGILHLRQHDVFSVKFNVYPCAGPEPDRYVRVSYLPGGGETRNAKGDDYSEIYEVRPLQEGDDLRHVHRQLSARFDEYIVKVGSDSKRPVYTYYAEDGLSFPEMTVRIAQMFTLKESIVREEGSFMAVSYKGRLFEIVTDSQLYDLTDFIYANYLPDGAGAGRTGK